MMKTETLQGKEGIFSVRRFVVAYPAVPLTVLLILLFSLIAPGFLALNTFQTAMKGNTVVLIGAIAAAIVILTGGIDLSISTVIAASAVFSAKYMQNAGDGPEVMLIGLLIAMLVGLLFGLVNGILIGVLGMQSFVVTMGVRLAARGIAMVVSAGAAVAGCPAELIMFSFQNLFGIPMVFVVGVILLILMAIVTKQSKWGRSLILLGSNRNSAEFCRINTRLVETAAYVLSGVLSGVAGFVSISVLGCALPGIGDNNLLLIIGGVVLGGTSMNGGEGSVARTLIGVALLAILTAGLDAMAVSFNVQQIIQGILIFAGYSITTFVSSKSPYAMR